MASSSRVLFSLLSLSLLLSSLAASPNTASFPWPLTPATLSDQLDRFSTFDADTALDLDLDLDLEDIDADTTVVSDRRSLYWRSYFISYGALSANRVPCPPRSGRSYYTHNCFKAHGPVRPYSRGCSAITRCRR